MGLGFRGLPQNLIGFNPSLHYAGHMGSRAPSSNRLTQEEKSLGVREEKGIWALHMETLSIQCILRRESVSVPAETVALDHVCSCHASLKLIQNCWQALHKDMREIIQQLLLLGYVIESAFGLHLPICLSP